MLTVLAFVDGNAQAGNCCYSPEIQKLSPKPSVTRTAKEVFEDFKNLQAACSSSNSNGQQLQNLLG